MAILNFKYGTGTPSAYEQGTVYVSTDNKKVYVGNPGGTGGFCIGDFIEVSVTASKGQQAALKALKGPQQNVLYLTYNATDGYDLWKYDGTDFINLTKTGEIFGLISALTEVVQNINSNVGDINDSLKNYLTKADAENTYGKLEYIAETYATKNELSTGISNLRTELVGVGASDTTDTIKKAIALANAAQTTADNAQTAAGGAQDTADNAAERVGAVEGKLAGITDATVKAYVDKTATAAKDAAIADAATKYATTGQLETTNSNVSSLSMRLGEVETVASGAASGVSTINLRLTGIGTEEGAVKSAIDAAKEAAINSAKEAADAAYPTKAQLETTNTNLSNLTTKVGTVETTANNAKNDITTINNRLSGIGTGEGAVQAAINTAKEGAVSDAKTYANNTFATKETVSTLDSKVDDLIEDIDNLSNIMNFIGVTTTNVGTETGKTAATVVVNSADHTAKAGDVVIYDATEFVYDGSEWQLIGNTSAEMEEINDLKGKVANLEGKVANSSALVTAVDKNTSDIGALDSRLDQAELDIDGLQGQLTWGTFTSLS